MEEDGKNEAAHNQIRKRNKTQQKSMALMSLNSLVTLNPLIVFTAFVQRKIDPKKKERKINLIF